MGGIDQRECLGVLAGTPQLASHYSPEPFPHMAISFLK